MVELKLKEGLDEFASSTQRILIVSKKPDTPQYINMIRVTALGLVVLGALGFAVELVSFFLRTPI
jgi:protein transport protein SEC61 subunit gamma-like protein